MPEPPAMISGVAELVMRVASALLLPLIIGEDGVFPAEILAWIGAAVWLMLGYYRVMRKYTRGHLMSKPVSNR